MGYRRFRDQLARSPVLCEHCHRDQATEPDHEPPIGMHHHREGTGCCRLVPSCRRCNREASRLVVEGRWRPGAATDALPSEPQPERGGLDAKDRRWRVDWLADLRRPPPDAVWPRLMTVPHPAAVGSLGTEFCAWAEERSGRPLRWWQRLTVARVLEVDGSGVLCWQAALVSLSRQLGKSWLLRELCLWRIHQGDRFGEPQDVLHTGKDLAVCKEVQRPARIWAKARPEDYKVREVNGQEEIEVLADGSRWMLRAKEATYGYSVSMAAADEAWKVRESSIEEGLTPTMVERSQPQLLLVSTAHRLATSLMIGRRAAALGELESGAGDLLIEWSAPEGTALDDRAGWRAASPHWTVHRERLIERQLTLARSGEIDDPEEPDAEQFFRAQWLNQWPKRITATPGDSELLLPAGAWDGLAADGLVSAGPLWVAVDDDMGYGAAVAAAARLEDGRVELDGWVCSDWAAAMADVEALAEGRGLRQLIVAAALVDRVPAGVGGSRHTGAAKDTRVGLATFRDLVMGGTVAHDNTPELDEALTLARVRETAAGLVLVASGPLHLIRAAVWAASAAARPAKVPAVH
jgi:hypothetical protein